MKINNFVIGNDVITNSDDTIQQGLLDKVASKLTYGILTDITTSITIEYEEKTYRLHTRLFWIDKLRDEGELE